MSEEAAKKSGRRAKGTLGPKRTARAPAAPERGGDGYLPRLKKLYTSEILPQLMQRFGYKNPHQAPRLSKICINMGIGEAVQNVKALEAAQQELEAIAGQRPAVRRAKKSISNFRLRAGMPIGCMVTLRGWRMYEFLDRLISVAVPRIRDFRGLPPRSFDGRGNYTLGIKEQIVFPEVKYDKVEKIRGMDITLATTAKSDEEGFELLKALGLPFRAR